MCFVRVIKEIENCKLPSNGGHSLAFSICNITRFFSHMYIVMIWLLSAAMSTWLYACIAQIADYEATLFWTYLSRQVSKLSKQCVNLWSFGASEWRSMARIHSIQLFVPDFHSLLKACSGMPVFRNAYPGHHKPSCHYVELLFSFISFSFVRSNSNSILN